MKYLADINERSLREDEDPRREFRYIDISAVGRGSLASEPLALTFGDAPSRARRLVQPGDTIVSTVRTYLRAVWPVEGPTDDLVVSTGFAVLTPCDELDERFLGWWAQSDPFIEEIVARSVGVSYPAINASDVGDLRMPVPPRPIQRAISDYLDAETSRIDALIGRKRQMTALLDEHRQSYLVRLLDDYPIVPLRRLAKRVDVGIAEAATHAYADHGVPLLRSTNIRANALDVSDLLYIEPWFAERNRSKFVHTGDILTVRTGNAGVSAVVPPEYGESQCFTQLITTLQDGQMPELVCAALNSTQTRAYFDQAGWGTAQSNISVPLLASAPVPNIPPSEQPALLARVRRIAESATRTSAALDRQIALLIEHRRALITATVTGELTLPELAA